MLNRGQWASWISLHIGIVLLFVGLTLPLSESISADRTASLHTQEITEQSHTLNYPTSRHIVANKLKLFIVYVLVVIIATISLYRQRVSRLDSLTAEVSIARRHRTLMPIKRTTSAYPYLPSTD